MNKIKEIIKNLIPNSFLEKRLRNYIVKQHRKFNEYDMNIFLEHSNILKEETQLKYVGRIVMLYHIIEKGLTMPEMKLGFGQPKLINLIDKCLAYQKKYDRSNIQYQHALGVIAEYSKVHKDNSFKIDSNLQKKIDDLLNNEQEIEISHQINKTRDGYFENQFSSFDNFSNSRFSIRNFSGKIEGKQIESAISLAQNTPTSCNRQTIRVHVIENKDLISRVFQIQNGNRGFGHLVDKLLVVTVDLSAYQESVERNLPYVDGGIYTMNLLYSLHFNKVAAIPLNWCVKDIDDLKMRKTIDIPDSEVIIVLIGCGNIPNEFKLAVSKRYDYKDIYKIHN